MSIELKEGNLFDADVDALVNTVNCVGIMGKGLALQFKQRFPNNFIEYKKECENGRMKIGDMFVYHTNGKYIINFPTKIHWKHRSQLSYIDLGLNNLIKVIKDFNIQSIAIPPLGCGLGGLDWKDVKNRIFYNFKNVDIRVLLYFNG